jgi:hypothetical protein
LHTDRPAVTAPANPATNRPLGTDRDQPNAPVDPSLIPGDTPTTRPPVVPPSEIRPVTPSLDRINRGVAPTRTP